MQAHREPWVAQQSSFPVVCRLGETTDATETEANLSFFFRRQFVTLRDNGRDVTSQRRLPFFLVVEHEIVHQQSAFSGLRSFR